MNVTDVKTQTVEGNALDAIFGRQLELLHKYHDVESRNGSGYAHVKDVPVDLHDRRAQVLLKDFAWRCTEEITEATIALHDYHQQFPDTCGVDLHTQEECADALHFLVELWLLAGVTSTQLQSIYGTINSQLEGLRYGTSFLIPTESAYDLVEAVGRAMNHLKNKPWKTSQMLTDIDAFRQALTTAYPAFLHFACALDIDTEDKLVDLYLRKSKVNDFRVRSQY